jgi:hypothetical protein
MTEIFADRLASKREMLRRARSGSELDDVTSAEADSGVEIPQVGGSARRNDSGGFASTHGSVISQVRRRRRLAVGAIAGLALCGLFAALWLSRERPADQRLRAVARSIPKTTLPAPDKKVVVSVSSVPTGATVLVAGQDLGKTPLDLTLPRGEETVVVEIKKLGFSIAREQVTPDVNQRVRVMLIAQRGPARAAKTAPETRGFRRFD